MIALVDISPNELYISFYHKNRFEFYDNKGKVLLHNGDEQNIHHRGKDNTNKRATGAGYKFDTKLIYIRQFVCNSASNVIDNFKKEKEI